jgi:hypothetical protein
MTTEIDPTVEPLTASDYALALFRPSDNAAILVRNRTSGKTVQRIAKAETVTGPEFQIRLPIAARKAYYRQILKIGRLVNVAHPEVASPEDWTRETAAQCVAMICRKRGGEWVDDGMFRNKAQRRNHRNAATRLQFLNAISTFFRDCQDWELIPRRLDALRVFSPPPSVQALGGTKPRAISRAAAFFLEGKENLLRLRKDIPLTEAERNAVKDGVNSFEKLLAPLSDVPTPAGPTPRQLQSGFVRIQSTTDRRK